MDGDGLGIVGGATGSGCRFWHAEPVRSPDAKIRIRPQRAEIRDRIVLLLGDDESKPDEFLDTRPREIL